MHVQTQGLRELMPLRNQRSDADNTWYEIQAIAEADGGFTLWCGGQEFSPLEFGKELYPAVARYILAMRSSPVRYPVYLTDLDLSAQYGE